MGILNRTVLFDRHQSLGARITEFAGFEMPVSYAGIIKEHLAVRSAAGLFDLSHMGEFEVRGPHALAMLQRALTNSAAHLREGRAQYSLLCTPSGGTIDDVIVYRLGAERYLLCVNASNVGADREWLIDLNRGRAEFEDVTESTALIGIQGPRTQTILQPMTGLELQRVARFGVVTATIAGAKCVAARTGYTGEGGFELFVAPEQAGALFDAILEAGRGAGLQPCGLGARDTLRLEAGLPLYGHELDRDTSPLEAGLGAFVRLDHDFVGAEALTRERADGSKKHLVGIRTDDGKSIARQGYKLFHDGNEIGVVTSGTFAPSFGRPLAMAYIRSTADIGAESPQAVAVEIRGSKVAATVTSLPFYRRGARAA
ncbi:MAG: glycine cleavage system aminomethyltransferase GcvT [Candidatus Binataceae bacterium]